MGFELGMKLEWRESCRDGGIQFRLGTQVFWKIVPDSWSGIVERAVANVGVR